MLCPRTDKPRAIFFHDPPLLHVSRRARRISFPLNTYPLLRVLYFSTSVGVCDRGPQATSKPGKRASRPARHSAHSVSRSARSTTRRLQVTPGAPSVGSRVGFCSPVTQSGLFCAFDRSLGQLSYCSAEAPTSSRGSFRSTQVLPRTFGARTDGSRRFSTRKRSKVSLPVSRAMITFPSVR